MANNKIYGYTPKTAKSKIKKSSAWSGEEAGGSSYENIGNKLDRLNPYEFRKGMDFELTEIGCSRLAESTVEEREKATESVIKNLETHQAYYSALIQFSGGMNQAGKIEEKTFKKYLESYTSERGDGMEEVQNTFKQGKMKDADHKNDGMVELKEAVRREVIKALRLETKDIDVDSEDEDETEVKATKGAKKAEKGMARFDREEKAIEELLYGKAKGDEDVDEENPGKGSLLFLKDKHLDAYKNDKDVDKYKEAIALPDTVVKKLEKHADIFSKLGNKIKTTDIKGKDLPDTIKKLELRKSAIKKERGEAQAEVGKQRNEIASTDMTRENHLRLLEIIKEHGISLREGADSIKSYYEIAKTSYLEGLSKGLRL